jgi:hypothetical protein
MKGYGNVPIFCRGYFEASVALQGVHLQSFRFYVTERGDNLMGMDLFVALGFKVTGPHPLEVDRVSSPLNAASEVAVNRVSSISLADYPVLCKSFGILKGFQHKPHVDHSVRPVRQPMRRLALALRDPVSAEINRMLSEGVIERIDTSPWVSNIVPAKKHDGSIRVCIDLSEPNKAIIPKHSLHRRQRGKWRITKKTRMKCNGPKHA